MKKIIMIIAILLSFCSCSFPSRNFKEDAPIIFPKPENIACNDQALIETFINSEYYDETKYGTIDKMEVCNYIPKKYEKKYKINLLGFLDNKTDTFVYYIVYKDTFLFIGSFGDDEFTNFALSDINKDGYFELSFICRSEKGYHEVLCFDSFYLKDGRQSYHTDNKYLLFNNDSKTCLNIYESSDDKISEDDELIESIIKNEKKARFASDYYQIKAKNYEAEIFFKKHYGNFPVRFKSSNTPGGKGVYCLVETRMKWLGPTFTYRSSGYYLDGIELRFFNEKDERYVLEAGVGSFSLTFTIIQGIQINCNYAFRTLNYEYGTYNMEAYYEYDEETVIIENVLFIEKC